MGSSCSPQSELTPLLLGLAQGYPVAARCGGDCIMCVAQGIKGHADLASSSPSSPNERDNYQINNYILGSGQSRVTLVTHDKGCVRYPTEGNSSNHELTTAMHHLSTCLARAIVSLGFHVSFKSW